MKLAEAKEGYCGFIGSITGSHHLLSRRIAIGIVEDSPIRVIQNQKGQPVLFYCRDSMIALSRKDCVEIEVKDGEHA